MADLKTKPNDQSVPDFINQVTPDKKKEDARVLSKLLQEITGEKPVMWGDSLIGYGNYRYKYESGREIDWFLAGFSPRKQNLTVYIMGGFKGHEELLERLGKYKKSVGCLYFKKLEDIDISTLKEMIARSVEVVKKRYAEYN